MKESCHCSIRQLSIKFFLLRYFFASQRASSRANDEYAKRFSITYTISCISVDYTRERDSDSLASRHDQLPARVACALSLITRAPLILLLSCIIVTNARPLSTFTDRSWKPLGRARRTSHTAARPWPTRIKPSMLHFQSLLFLHVVE